MLNYTLYQEKKNVFRKLYISQIKLKAKLKK